MPTYDLRPVVVDIAMLAGDSLDGLEVTVDDPVYAGGSWSAQLRPTADSEQLHASFTIVPNGEGTGVILSLDGATTRLVHSTYARVVRDETRGLVRRYVGVFDVQSIPAGGGSVLTAVSGTLTVDQDVTR